MSTITSCMDTPANQIRDASDGLLDELNDAQCQAVTAPMMPLMVSAGPGSGKTKVLVHRIAYLLQQKDWLPRQILAVTFTNKAAREMQARLQPWVDDSLAGMWIGTFHGLSYRLLRQHHELVHLPSGFQIIDQADQERLMKRLVRELQIDVEKYPARKMVQWINRQKDEGLRVADLPHPSSSQEGNYHRIYQAYEQARHDAGLVDFAELLLLSLELLRKNPTLCDYYQSFFRAILVDEFQDTNTVQYEWVKLLAASHQNIMVVGDDDQCIYSWRGARVENIQRFRHDFPKHHVIALTQNYRSTQTILRAVNGLIDHNDNRLGKKLWTAANTGQKIKIYAANNELDEASYVVQNIRQWNQLAREEPRQRSEIGILYRSNAQSRVLEDALLRAHIPYQIYGGLRFYERQEIKDALAYGRLLLNPHDNSSFERVINVPARGLGDRSLEKLRLFAHQHSVSLWRATEIAIEQKIFSGRPHTALTEFVHLITTLSEARYQHDYALPELINRITHDTGLVAMYAQDQLQQGQNKVENLAELVNAAHQSAQHGLSTEEALVEFLAMSSLDSGIPEPGGSDHGVQLMTLHSAKGLEFALVFMVGLEEGLFPTQNAIYDEQKLQEERRLCYVGMTRAMESLIMIYAQRRRTFGDRERRMPSRFLKEIPEDTMEKSKNDESRQVRRWGQISVSEPASTQKTDMPIGRALASPYHPGQRVVHARFGQGVVVQCDGTGERARVQVRFSDGESKYLIAGYAKLKLL